MAKPPKEQNHETEVHSDAREGFERAVDAAVKSGPKHKVRPRVSYSEPTVVYEIRHLKDGRVIISNPYLVLPDGKVATLIAF